MCRGVLLWELWECGVTGQSVPRCCQSFSLRTLITVMEFCASGQRLKATCLFSQMMWSL